MIICVIDGQGGGIGAAVIKRLREEVDERVELVALGTNAIATAQMLKARANRGASGENAIMRTVREAEILIGPVSILMAHAMMGEMTPKMAEAISGCAARKFLIPLTREPVTVVGTASMPLPHYIERLMEELNPLLTEEASHV
ncbi:MAG: hypothetical protein CSB33_01270 [Desulfobacterales bacterium]|nr:MAG: hypothetical protein CSB33_01270 [Desulfobacterales bacterium]